MNQLSAALNRVRSSLENVNRLLDRLPDDDERRHHSDLIEEPIVHEYGHEHGGHEPEQESECGPATMSRYNVPDTTDEPFEHSNSMHRPQFLRSNRCNQ